MSRRYVRDLSERDELDQVFLAADKQLRANRAGNLYMHVRLADRTGVVSGMLWNASEKLSSTFETGDFVNVQGSTQIYNGNLQVIVNRIDRVDPSTVDESEFFQLATANIDTLGARLAEMLRSQSNVHLRNLAECFLVDEEFMDKISRAPAGVKNHHAYRGGLLEHIVSVMELTAIVAPRYEDVDADLLLMGAFLHDAGKIDELCYDRQLGYSDEGQLVGHLVMGVGLLDAKLGEVEKLSGEPFPSELAHRLKHMIVSHHGQYEYGSPKLPMTMEAVVLHHLDNIDARLHNFRQLISEDPVADSRWTAYQPNLGRKIYKGAISP